MDSEKPPRNTSNSNSSSTSELFICFTSRLSFSSMKLSSKSIFSPSRSREPSQISLSTSLSRRLKSNASIKGGQASPMFPTGGKKRGSAFDNPEPSSPKVTCIGQVRVKTKKGRKMRTRSKRRGEASFRKTEQNLQIATANSDLNQQNGQTFQYQNHQNMQQECLPHRNQRWVHLPLTICEALRAFGAEFSCFFPCRSSCMSSEREKGEKTVGVEGPGGGNGREGSCGAAFAKWLVTLQEGDAKSREIELVVDEKDTTGTLERSHRRHIFEDIDIKVEKNEEYVGEEEEKARVSICIPPKNALLLMRCRSDPVKMAALANRFFDSPAPKDEDEDVNGDDDEDDHNRVHMEEDEEEKEKCDVPLEVACEDHVIPEAEVEAKQRVEEYEIESRANLEPNGASEACQDEQSDEEESVNEEDKNLVSVSSPEVALDLEKVEIEEIQLKFIEDGEEKLKEEENNEDDHNEQSLELASSPAVSAASESENSEEAAVMAEASAEAATEDSKLKEKETTERFWEDEETATHNRSDPDDPRLYEQKVCPDSKERENPSKPDNRGSSALPDCLLLMMCEPKLSMEVSKETWVCSTDFIRWLPERPVKKKEGGDQPKKRISIDSRPPLPPHMLQPPRSSCSFPVAPMSMATVIEQKLVGSKPNACEPFVLTRCKSEPRRSSSTLAPEACFWKNRKLEPHHPPATLGVGAAGVGF